MIQTLYSRIEKLNSYPETKGTVVYWMSRDQRMHDNWALHFAQEKAKELGSAVSVVFCLRPSFPYATERLIDFLLTGLEELEATCTDLGIPFYFLLGDPTTEIPRFCKAKHAGCVVTDFNPLSYKLKWDQAVAGSLSTPFYRVDAHNIVPIQVASKKQEFGAYTLRPKINKLLPEYLESIPKIKKQTSGKSKTIQWDQLRKKITFDTSVPKITWAVPGEKAAHTALRNFISNRLSGYSDNRNDPTLKGQSDLSPYLHFGQLSAQRLALEVSEAHAPQVDIDAFLEELIIRSELSDNFCFYNKNYDNPKGFPDWAKKSLMEHAHDSREFVYTLREFENAKTHEDLWNAAQIELTQTGKLHGYMRMYWAKKIFEWTKSPTDAMKIAIYLNDKYELDGRDPNGYTGIAWSMGGVHDRAWFDRPVFGKIRYMNANGAKSKFNTNLYIQEHEVKS